MHTHLNPRIIALVMIAVAVLPSTITLLVIAFTGKFWPSADAAIAPAIQKARNECGCRCHEESMFPGMRCLDCYNELCDEGTQQ